jgi:LruC domain-containing protein
MNRRILIPVAVAVTLALAGCYQPVSTGPGASGSQATPSDQVTNVQRSASGEFSFETVLDTDVRVVVRGESDDGSAFPPLAGAIVRFESESGNALFQGRADSDGAVSGTVSLPAAPQDVTLRVSADGYAPREVTIADMVEYAEVSRVMYLEQGGFSTQVAGDVDSDGDSVPDVYDAFPDDETAAFATDYPADGTYTVAYEDLYGRERAGDADYNDFVAHYSLTEETNDDGLITRITGEATAVAKMAGYNHRFGLFFRFEGEARLKVLYNQTAAEAAMDQIQGRLVTDEADAVLFDSTNAAVGRTSFFELDFSENPQDPANINRAPYDPYLYVKNTGHDVHLIGEEPLPGSNNPDDDDFRDGDGYPWALLVPADWQHPDERQRIDEAYPAFTYWRQSEGEYYPDWYLYHGVDPGPPVDDPADEPVVYVAGYYNDGTRDVAAYWTDDGGNITRHDLYPSALSEATDIAVEADGTVHAVGYYRSAGIDVAAYWRDGNVTALDSPGRATGLAVSDTGTVYVSGYYDDGSTNIASYWSVDGTTVVRDELYEASRSAATDVDLGTDGTLYVSGYYNNDSHDVAAYWTVSGGTGSREDLYTATLSQAYAIHSGSNFLVAGRFLGADVQAAYWEDDATGLQVLPGASGDAQDVIALSGTSYTVGSYTSPSGRRRAVYWRGTEPFDLLGTDPATATQAYGVSEKDGVLYVAGLQNTGTEEAVYWRDGSVTELTAGIESRGVAISLQ